MPIRLEADWLNIKIFNVQIWPGEGKSQSFNPRQLDSGKERQSM